MATELLRLKGKNKLLKPLPWIMVLAITALSFYACSPQKEKPPALEPGPNNYDVVVIGAGGGGVSAAARLALAGMKTLVIEQHDRVGGYMSAFERDDFRFEVSLHAMDGMGREIFPRLGIEDKVKVVKLDPAYQSIFPDFTFDVPADPELYRQRLKEKFPHEAEGIDGLFDMLESIYKGMRALMDLRDGNYGKGLWAAIKNPKSFWLIYKYWDENCTNMFGEYIKDPKLIALIIQLMAYTGTDSDSVSGMFFAMMWISYHHVGYYYFEGGSQAVTKACAEVVEENGGKVLLNTLVTKIDIKDGKAVGVQTKDGQKFNARYVVSNANAPDTFFKLVGEEYLPEQYVKDLKAMTIGLPSFAVYIGTDKDFSDTFPNGIHSYFINPSYNQQELFKAYREGIPEEVMYGLINYTMVDPTNAPKGKNIIAIVTIMPYDYKGDWYESVSYEKYKALKEEVAQIMIQRTEEYIPGLSEHIEVMEIGSPRTMEHYTLNPKGSIFGWEFTKEQSMMKRLPQETPIENLYLAGAWTFPSGGQSGVLMSGDMAADMIIKREK